METFICENCCNKFIKKNTDEEALKELEQSPWFVPEEEVGCICDDCFPKFKKWFDALTPEDHKRIRSKTTRK